jgi:hypothetical protein
MNRHYCSPADVTRFSLSTTVQQKELNATVTRKLFGSKKHNRTQLLHGLRRKSQASIKFRLLACWECGFESHWGHICLSLMSVVCCQVEVSAMG